MRSRSGLWFLLFCLLAVPILGLLWFVLGSRDEPELIPRRVHEPVERGPDPARPEPAVQTEPEPGNLVEPDVEVEEPARLAPGPVLRVVDAATGAEIEAVRICQPMVRRHVPIQESLHPGNRGVADLIDPTASPIPLVNLETRVKELEFEWWMVGAEGYGWAAVDLSRCDEDITIELQRSGALTVRNENPELARQPKVSSLHLSRRAGGRCVMSYSFRRTNTVTGLLPGSYDVLLVSSGKPVGSAVATVVADENREVTVGGLTSAEVLGALLLEEQASVEQGIAVSLRSETGVVLGATDEFAMLQHTGGLLEWRLTGVLPGDHWLDVRESKTESVRLRTRVSLEGEKTVLPTIHVPPLISIEIHVVDHETKEIVPGGRLEIDVLDADLPSSLTSIPDVTWVHGVFLVKAFARHIRFRFEPGHEVVRVFESGTFGEWIIGEGANGDELRYTEKLSVYHPDARAARRRLNVAVRKVASR